MSECTHSSGAFLLGSPRPLPRPFQILPLMLGHWPQPSMPFGRKLPWHQTPTSLRNLKKKRRYQTKIFGSRHLFIYENAEPDVIMFVCRRLSFDSLCPIVISLQYSHLIRTIVKLEKRLRMLKFLNPIVKSYRWYDKRKCGKEGPCIYRPTGGVRVRDIKLFILEVKTIQMQIMMLNTYPFEIQF